MRTTWQEIPMLRIAFALIVGVGLEIATDRLLHLEGWVVWVAASLLLLSIITLLVISRIKNVSTLFRLRIYQGIALLSLIVALGYILAWLNTDKNYPQFFGNNITFLSKVIVQINEPPIARPTYISAVGEVVEGLDETHSTKTMGNVLLRFPDDSSSHEIKYGDVILFSSRITPIQPPKNPEEFNYQRYQAYRNVNYQCYVTGNWKIIKRGQGNFLLSAIYRLRDNFLHVIEKYVKNENDFGVASALMLGYRDYINEDIMRAYASSGVIHVLSVSGLHVSIMFIMLNFLLKGLDERGKKLAVTKAAIIISFIWFYACLTGLSPPVLRSALMFTLIQIGNVFLRNKNTYNLITASAVLLLLFNPFLVMDVGFQLSYLAVYGIVYLFPKIYNLWAFKNWFIDKGWALIAVSLAAQIVTMPLSLYYFHQFPNLFLLSNLFVIPFSDIVLYTGTALFAVSHIPFVNDVTGWIFNMEIGWLNKFIFWVDGLPFALVKGLNMTLIEMVLVYLLLVLLCWLSEEKKAKILIVSLVVLFSLSSFHSYKTVTNANRKEIVVYCVPKHRAIAFIDGTMVQYYFDKELHDGRNLMQRYINNHWISCGIKKEMDLDTVGYRLPFGRVFLFEGKKILVVDSALTNEEVPVKLKVNLVIISGIPEVHLAQLKKQIDFSELVLDSSNKPKEVKYLMSEAEEMGVKCWDAGKGAYVKEVNN